MKSKTSIFSILLLSLLFGSCSDNSDIDDEIIRVSSKFNANRTTIQEGEKVNFSDVSTGSPTAWNWTFEGGSPSSSTDQNPTVTYSTEGIFDVSLIVFAESFSDMKTEGEFIEVENTPLVASFNSSSQNVLINTEVSFLDLSAGNPIEWEWTFEGGTPSTSTEQNPTVIYDKAGIHKVRLVVRNEQEESIYEEKDHIISTSAFNNSPPFSGTIFLTPDIITRKDPSMFVSASYQGQEMRTMFDRRVNDFIQLNAHIVDVIFENDIRLEVQVNPEFNSTQAQEYAEFYAEALGRIPTAFFEDAETVWIHDGNEPFGGGNNNFLIHVGQGELYEADGVLEETFIHEGCHTSFDDDHAESSGWLNAQSNDFSFISTYARDNSDREDVAESYLLILAALHRRDRISSDLFDTILGTIPERVRYFNNQEIDLYPLIQ